MAGLPHTAIALVRMANETNSAAVVAQPDLRRLWT
jgi:hypothetical protein